MHFELPFLKAALQPGSRIQTSLTPNVPGKDERITNEVVSVEVRETVSGLLLILVLRNSKETEPFTYVFPDIQKIERHSIANKYYLYCVDRENLSEHSLKKATEIYDAGGSIENLDIYEDAPLYTHRIMIM